ncbi:thioesterase family protein [Streptomyces sp. NPDC093221]|uniref:thioesterase family protein n=1 Tax=Streptomyces sp. NPDC093221 TaxID=3366032 RepID=UPI00380EB666
MGEPTAFYEPDPDGSFVATDATQGPWSPDLQHGGPPSALLVREFEALVAATARDGDSDGDPDSDSEGHPDGHLAKIAMDFHGPVPVGPVRVRASVLKPGRRAQLLAGELSVDGRVVLSARAWWRRRSPGLVPDVPVQAAPLPDPDDVVPADPLPGHLDHGWIASMDYRYLAGFVTTPGPATVWVRPKFPLVAGETTSGTQRAVLVSDGASGFSAALDFRTHLFSNLDLVLSFLRPPVGPWVALDAVSALDGAGGGTTSTRLADTAGYHGFALQTLYVAPHHAV